MWVASDVKLHLTKGELGSELQCPGEQLRCLILQFPCGPGVFRFAKTHYEGLHCVQPPAPIPPHVTELEMYLEKGPSKR